MLYIYYEEDNMSLKHLEKILKSTYIDIARKLKVLQCKIRDRGGHNNIMNTQGRFIRKNPYSNKQKVFRTTEVIKKSQNVYLYKGVYCNHCKKILSKYALNYEEVNELLTKHFDDETCIKHIVPKSQMVRSKKNVVSNEERKKITQRRLDIVAQWRNDLKQQMHA